MTVRDLVSVGNTNVTGIIAGLNDKSAHGRQVCSMALEMIKTGDFSFEHPQRIKRNN